MRSRGSGGVALAASLVAAGAALGMAEATLLPPLPVPGVRLGIANVALLLALSWLGPRGALAVGAARVALVGLATGSLGGPATLMASCGCLAAWVGMSLVSRSPSFSLVGWSVAGSAAHVLAQIAAACFLTGSVAPLGLVPLALGLSLPAGLATGSLACAVVSRLPRTVVLFAE